MSIRSIARKTLLGHSEATSELVNTIFNQVKHPLPVSAITLLGAITVAGCAPPEKPIDYEGTPVAASPLPAKDVTVHPIYDGHAFSSTFHSDHYNSDVMGFSAPLGINPVVTFQNMGISNGGICSTPRVNSQGQIVVGCQDGALTARQRKLVLMDADMNILAESKPGEWQGATVTEEGVGGGVYPHILSDDSVVNGTAAMTVERWEVVADPESVTGLSWTKETLFDLKAQFPNDQFFEVVEDYNGKLWFITLGGLQTAGASVGVIDPVTGVATSVVLSGEAVENGLAIGEDGIYALTNKALYGFELDGSGNIVQNWRHAYDVTSTPRSEWVSDGSGTTPTLLGRDLIAIVDNAETQVNLVVLLRDASVATDRLVCKVPLFSPGSSVVDVSPIGYGNSLVIQNWSGMDPASELGGIPTLDVFGSMTNMAGGFTRIDVREDRSGCDVIWERPDLVHNTVPQLSTQTGLIYTYTQDQSFTSRNAYYFEAIDFQSGQTVWRKLAGVENGGFLDTSYYNATLTLSLGPDGSLYQGIFGGLLKLEDQP